MEKIDTSQSNSLIYLSSGFSFLGHVKMLFPSLRVP